MIKSRDGQMVEGHIPGLVAFYFFFKRNTNGSSARYVPYIFSTCGAEDTYKGD
jgi:hypothetical protein